MATEDRKRDQLGMTPGKAANRLVKDILYSKIVQCNENECFRCGKPMTRETFSIEHKTAWLDSGSPVEMFFDLNNITFSHLSCNIKASRGNRKYKDSEEAKEARRVKDAEHKRKSYTPEKRREKYLTKGQ